MTNASQSWLPRAAWFEALLAAVTASCLIAQYARSSGGPIDFWLALPWGLVTALAASRHASRRYRVWGLLALTNLAISAWIASPAALAALWLPSVTLVALRWLESAAMPALATIEATVEAPVSFELPDDHDRQHTVEWSQVHDRQGAKSVNGVARLMFRPGERQTELHLAFCPSFPTAPAFHVEQTGGPDVRIKTTQVMPYGARLEVQRSEATAWCVVALEFTAAQAPDVSAASTSRLAS